MGDDDEYRGELRGYVLGIVLALLLSVIPFALVGLHAMMRFRVLVAVAACAVVQVVVHFRLFLHIDLSRQKRDDLQLILFSTLIVVLMVGGTIWIIMNEHAKML